jgi:hypothetical protein
MPRIVQSTSTDSEPEAQRAIVRLALDEIATEANIALRESGLSFPVGLAIPSSGYALITMITPIDPSEEDWAQATGIVRHIVSSKLGGIRMRSQPLPCTMVNATMGAAEVTSDMRTED